MELTSCNTMQGNLQNRIAYPSIHFDVEMIWLLQYSPSVYYIVFIDIKVLKLNWAGYPIGLKYNNIIIHAPTNNPYKMCLNVYVCPLKGG